MIVHMLTGRAGLYKTLDFAEEFQPLQSLKVKKNSKKHHGHPMRAYILIGEDLH